MRSNLMTLPQLHRSSRTSQVRLWIRDYQLVVLFMVEICTLFVCYACIGYFSQFAYAFIYMAHFHELVDIQSVLLTFWFQIIVIIIAASIRSNPTIDGNRFELDSSQICLYQTVNLFSCYTLFIKLIGSMLYIDHVPFSR